MDFHQTFVSSAFWDIQMNFSRLGVKRSKVKVPGVTVAD